MHMSYMIKKQQNKKSTVHPQITESSFIQNHESLKFFTNSNGGVLIVEILITSQDSGHLVT